MAKAKKKGAAKKASKKAVKKTTPVVETQDAVPEDKKADYEAEPGLPLFQSHKVVEAFKILSQDSLANGQRCLVGEDHQVIVDHAYVEKHRPQAGGYYVRYPGGYESWSPADAFEDGYTPLKAKD